MDCKKDQILPYRCLGLISYPSFIFEGMIILRNNSRGDNSFTVDLSQHVNIDHCTYHDPIDVLLEKSFRVRFPVNNKFLILHLLGIDLDSFDFDFCFLPFLFLICDVHVFIGLSLYGWLHWKFDFT